MSVKKRVVIFWTIILAVIGVVCLYWNFQNEYSINWSAFSKNNSNVTPKKEETNKTIGVGVAENKSQPSMEECIEVVSTECKDGRIYITVKNIGDKEIGYVKVNIFYYDMNGNSITTDFTNTINPIPTGYNTVLDKYIPDYIEGEFKYTVQIDSIRRAE